MVEESTVQIQPERIDGLKMEVQKGGSELKIGFHESHEIYLNDVSPGDKIEIRTINAVEVWKNGNQVGRLMQANSEEVVVTMAKGLEVNLSLL